LAGKDVRILQNLIIRSPFVQPKITLNNIYDDETARAVMQFQQAHHMYANL
jgi:peptidoglycan hydrolase-like protein with peptidoglycan-binding domain